MRNKLDYNKIKELYYQNLNDNEIARLINASVNGVRYVRKDVLGLPNVIKVYPITKEMEEVLIGTLLGDGWIGYVHKGCTMPKFQVGHCIKQELYTNTIYNILKPIMSDYIYKGKRKICLFSNGKKYEKKETIIIYSKNIKELIPYRNAFYPNGKKIIPLDFIKDKFTTKSLAYWFMDDGSCDRKGHSFIINTQCFDRDNLQEFIDYLYEKFNLEFTIKKDKSLYLRHKSNETFINLIKPYLTEDMQYKIALSINSVKRGKSRTDDPVLNHQEIDVNAERLEVTPNE